MNPLIVSLYLILLLLTTLSAGAARIGHLRGLPNNYVNAFAQDHDGYVYIGTQNGLYRYDGNRITRCNIDGSDGEFVTSLYYEPEHDRLWVGTESGLTILALPALTPTLTDISEHEALYNINDIRSDSKGGIWIVNHYDNLVHYNGTNDRIEVYDSGRFRTLPAEMLTACEDDKGNLWVGHYNSGISIINLSTGHITSLRHNPDDKASLPSDRVNVISRDSYNNMWAGTSGGLALYIPATDNFRVFSHIPGNASTPAGNNISAIIETGNGQLTVASNIGGISSVSISEATDRNSLRTDIFESLPNSETDNTLSSKSIKSLLKDSFGNLWIGNFGTGVDIVPHHSSSVTRLPWYDVEGPGVRYYPVWSVASDRTGTIRAGGENKIAHFRNGHVEKISDLTPLLTHPYDWVEDILATGDKILVGLDKNGVVEIDPATDRIRRIPFPGQPDLPMNSFTSVNDSLVLIGTEAGLYRYEGGKIEDDAKVNEAISYLNVTSVIVDRMDNLWVGTYGGGIFIFDRTRKPIGHYDDSNGLDSRIINHIIEDSRGNVWAATGNGIRLFRNGETGTPVNIDNKGELHGVICKAIAEDPAGNLWFTTDNAIMRIHAEHGLSHVNYAGLNDYISFMPRAIAVNDSSLYFGSMAGVLTIPHSQPDHVSTDYHLLISDCYYPQQGSEAPHPFKTLSDGTIVIPADKNSFILYFSIPDYSLSGLIEYSYQIEGIDRTWHSTYGKSFIELRNLRHGHYRLLLRATLPDGTILAENSVRIRVLAPLLLRWYMIALYIMLAAAIISAFLYLRIRYVRNKVEMESQLEISKSEQRLNKERLRFYTDVSHELRTPLTLIKGPADDLLTADDIPAKYQTRIRYIHKNTDVLLNLVNQLMDLRKTEADNIRAEIRYGNLSEFITEIALWFKESVTDSEIHCNIEPGIDDFPFDPKLLRIILNNLISNALKYGRSARGIEIELHLNPKANAEITVTDYGMGIAPEYLPHIFEQFYRVPDTEIHSHAPGTGIGLSLVKRLALLLNIELRVNSTPGQSTTFGIILPGRTNAATLKSEDIRNIRYDEDRTKPVLLVVEDNSEIRNYIKESLDSEFEIITADNGDTGLDKAIASQPDIIVSDIMMPGIDGVELCRRLKSDITTSHIPIILLTAKDSLADKEVGYAAGAESYITKPFSSRLLLARIHNIMEANRRMTMRLAGMGMATAPSRSESADSSQGVAADSEAKVEIRPFVSEIDKAFLTGLQTLIIDNLLNEQFGIPTIATELNISQSTLYRKVSSLTGTSVVAYIRHIRMSHAAQLLLKGYATAQVAEMCGFKETGYFRTIFKKEFGLSPKDYLHRHHPGEL